MSVMSALSERRLARARRAREPDRVCVARLPKCDPAQLASGLAVPFDERKQPGERTPIARGGLFEELSCARPEAAVHGVDTRSTSAPIERRRPARSS